MSEAPRQISSRQLSILACIAEGIQSHGFPPTVREIANTVGLASPSSAKYQLDLIEKAGIITRDPRRSRTIEITELGLEILRNNGVNFSQTSSPALSLESTTQNSATPNNDAQTAQRKDLTVNTIQIQTSEFDSTSETVAIPLVGTIAAGTPITATEERGEMFTLPRQITGNGELFMLLVQGDSMIDAAICDGDWVVVRQQSTAENGEIVAAMIDGEATVKVWQRRDGHSWLLPRNSEYAPIPGDHATILGKVVTVLRSL